MTVLLLSRNVAIYSTRRLTEAFRARGRSTVVLDPAAIGIRVGDGDAEAVGNGEPLADPEVLVPRIGFAVTEHAALVLAYFEGRGVPTTATARAVRTSRDKMRCLQRLTEAGLPVPPTTLVRRAEDADWAVDRVGGPPVVMKLLSGTHGVGVFLAESREAARTVLDAMLGIDRNLLVQRYVQSAAGRDLRLLVVGEEVVAAIRREAPPGSFRANIHHGGRATAVEPGTEAVDLALRSTRAVGLSVAGVDLLEDDGRWLVNEVNSSPGLEGVEAATGVDVAGRIADHALRLASEARGE